MPAMASRVGNREVVADETPPVLTLSGRERGATENRYRLQVKQSRRERGVLLASSEVGRA